MRPRKVVITAAGMGTRLLPMSKELPKEMLPLYARSGDTVFLKPLLQLVFEQLFDFGLRDFCFVVGRDKRAIEDHFTGDLPFLNYLNGRGKDKLAKELGSFYDKVENSNIIWVNQSEPGGFGDAVLKAKGYVDGEDFLVAAGDTLILRSGDRKADLLKRILEAHSRLGSCTTFAVMRVLDPEHYGVVLTEKRRPERVVLVEEKPARPRSNLAIMPLYLFKPVILDALESVRRGAGDELQLTDAIQELIHRGETVCAVRLGPGERRLDIGTPETYWEAIGQSYRIAKLTHGRATFRR